MILWITLFAVFCVLFFGSDMIMTAFRVNASWQLRGLFSAAVTWLCYIYLPL